MQQKVSSRHEAGSRRQAEGIRQKAAGSRLQSEGSLRQAAESRQQVGVQQAAGSRKQAWGLPPPCPYCFQIQVFYPWKTLHREVSRRSALLSRTKLRSRPPPFVTYYGSEPALLSIWPIVYKSGPPVSCAFYRAYTVTVLKLALFNLI
jgi:hypothetical protein